MAVLNKEKYLKDIASLVRKGAVYFEEADRPEIDVQLVATIQIWEILYIGVCAGAAFLRWNHRRKKRIKAKRKLLAQNG